jgi:hypothetical protein
MAWTHDEKLEHLLRLPWSLQAETTPEGDRLLRVVEIPSAVGCGASDEELEADLWESLRASLEAYLHFSDPIHVPGGASLPWDVERTASDKSESMVPVPRRIPTPDGAVTVDAGVTGGFATGRTEVRAA